MALPLDRMRIVAWHGEDSVSGILDALDRDANDSIRFRYFNTNKWTWGFDYNLLNINFSDRTFWPVGEDMYISILYPASTPSCERTYLAHPRQDIYVRLAETGEKVESFLQGDTPYSAFTIKLPLSDSEIHSDQDEGFDTDNSPIRNYIPTNISAWKAQGRLDRIFRYRFAPTYTEMELA